MSIEKAYFAGGCFWGVEYYFSSFGGVKNALSGFMGGNLKNPSYEDICYKNTGHFEVVEVTYNSRKVTFEALVKLFFEIHNPSQEDGQGPDIGTQYLSAIFISNKDEDEIVKKLIKKLENDNIKVFTKILNKQQFYEAEDYHQHYYEKNNKIPYCHSYVKKF